MSKRKRNTLTTMKKIALAARMPIALDLVTGGMTAYAAAQQVGLTSGAIYKNAEYKKIMAAKKEAKS